MSRRKTESYRRVPTQADALRSDEHFRAQSARQTDKITSLLGFIQSKGLVDEYQAYEERNSNGRA